MLQVNPTPDALTAITFTFVVPGHQQWSLRAIRADVDRGVGGLPNRAYRLDITDGTNIVASSGADDAGTEPGITSITWCAADKSATTAGSDGVVVAPLGPTVVYPGYNIVATILHPAGADTWIDAVAWYDFVYTTP